MKLLAVEAYLATGNPSQATQLVNDVRRRARLSTPDGTQAAAPADYSAVNMQNLVGGRLLELAGEDGIR